MTVQPITFVVLSKDLDNFNDIRAALNADSRAKLLSGGNDADQVYDQVKRYQPSAAIINLGADADTAVHLIRRLKTDCPKTALISAAREISSDLISQSMQAGALEFLRLPAGADELKAILDRIGEFCAGKIDEVKARGRMIAVFSNKGGCGTSFIATNLAAAANARAVLVDLNLESGNLAMYLGLDPKYSLADLAVRQGLIDERLISSVVAPYSSNLDLLSAPRDIDPIEKIKPEHVFEVLQRLHECYDYIVLDPQHTFDPITLIALDQADEIVLVLSLDSPAIRSTKRALQILDHVGCPRAKIRVVVNRWSRMVDLDLPQVEEFLGEPVIGSLPSDYQTVVKSINMGTPLVKSDPKSKIAREIMRIAQSYSRGEKPPEDGKLTRWWNLFLKRRASGGGKELS